MIVQGTFSVVAKSEAMWADTMAMSVDALTYLFNLLAERLKHTSFILEFWYRNSHLSTEELARKRKEFRLYLEFIIPVISVTALIIVSMQTFIEATMTIHEAYAQPILSEPHSSEELNEYYQQQEESEPNVNLMLFFSALNLGLDIMNVTCFAKATNFSLQGLGASTGLQLQMSDEEDDTEQLSSIESSQSNSSTKKIRIDVEMNICDEADQLLNQTSSNCVSCDYGSSNICMNGESDSYDNLSHDANETGHYNSIQNKNIEAPDIEDGISEGLDDDDSDSDISEAMSENSTELLNLNMCSAYTHVMADTLRSIAVLIAAGIASVCKGIDPSIADASASIIVSFIIAISLGPLIVGLLETLKELAEIRRERLAKRKKEPTDEVQTVFLEQFQSLPHGIYQL